MKQGVGQRESGNDAEDERCHPIPTDRLSGCQSGKDNDGEDVNQKDCCDEERPIMNGRGLEMNTKTTVETATKG